MEPQILVIEELSGAMTHNIEAAVLGTLKLKDIRE